MNGLRRRVYGERTSPKIARELSSSRILASSGPSRSSGVSRRMVMSVSWEAPSRVPAVIIVVSSFRVGCRPGQAGTRAQTAAPQPISGK